jgi:hypothetical protein
MADITLYKPANITVDVKDGNPPVDQSAQVAQLTTDLATRTTERDAALADAVAKQAKIDAAKAALA